MPIKIDAAPNGTECPKCNKGVRFNKRQNYIIVGGLILELCDGCMQKFVKKEFPYIPKDFPEYL
jgi:hypothetical protein